MANLEVVNRTLALTPRGNIGDVLTIIDAQTIEFAPATGTGTVGPGTPGHVAVFITATSVGNDLAATDTTVDTPTGHQVRLAVNAVPVLSVGVALVTSTMPIAVGVNPALSGAVRLANAAGVVSRNAANLADVPVLSVDGFDTIQLGSNLFATVISGDTQVLLRVNNADAYNADTIEFYPSDDSVKSLGLVNRRWTNFFLSGQVHQTGADGAAAGAVLLTNAPTSNVVQYVPFTFNGAPGWIPWIPA